MYDKMNLFLIVVVFLFVTIHSAPSNDTLLSSDKNKVTNLSDKKWEAFVEDVQDANRDFIKGEIESTINIWSHGNDVTIFGGFGGLVEPGWKNVESRLLWAVKKFTGGTYTYKPINYIVNGSMGYLLQTEQWLVQGKPEMNLRVTMICRLESDGWKIVHRHGEIIQPKETIK